MWWSCLLGNAAEGATVPEEIAFAREGQRKEGEEVNDQRSDVSSRPSDADVSSRPSEKLRKFNTKAFVPFRENAPIFSRYELDSSEIGHGGYGKVFVAEDKEIPGRRVAIKRLAIPNDQRRALFQKEAHIMKDLDHPHICRLLETYEQGRCMWFVMELCEGGDVFERLLEEGAGIGEFESATVVKQVASALRYAHSQGIAHRDLKPENCVYCSADPQDHHVKVIDWGVASYFGRTAMRSGVGSSVYIAPEVLGSNGSSNHYTETCDLWSLGVMTYVMLCGRAPFWGNPAQQLERMKAEKYPMADSTWRAHSADAKGFIRGLLRVEPQMRLTVEQVVQHRWLQLSPNPTDPFASQQILSNLRTFSRASRFFSICCASIARQLDGKSLEKVREVFSQMDVNGDGVLDQDEVRLGFEMVFGTDSPILEDLEEMFLRLDLDGSGTIDYSEFCAAGVSELLAADERALKAAFKTFDHVQDGRLTKEGIMQVLAAAGSEQDWSPGAGERVAADILERFDGNGDGVLDFEEWLQLVAELRKPAPAESPELTTPTLLGRIVSGERKPHQAEAAPNGAGGKALSVLEFIRAGMRGA